MKTYLTIIIALFLTACHATTKAPEDLSVIGASLDGNARIITTESQNDFDTTLSTLRSVIDAKGFKTFAVVDHAAGARSIDLELAPTTLIVFGNPKGGTPLLQADSRLGLELPLRMLVRENANGSVEIIHEDLAALFAEYGVAGLDANLGAISNALNGIAAAAAGSQ